MLIPPETVDLILGHLSRSDLVPTLVVHSSFHHLAARVLYRALVDVPPKQTLHLVKTLARNDLYPLFVRRFDLEWSFNILTANFLRLLHHTLQRLRHLSYLGLEFSKTDTTANLAWILHDCSFSLRVFSTSMRCDPPLVRFLETQHAVTEICLRGFSPTLSLAPHALPRLRHLRTVLAPPHVTADFVRGRPVQTVSLSLSPGDAAASLDALLLSTCPLRRLTVMSFDFIAPAEPIALIAARLPALEALHAVVFPRHPTHASPPLRVFSLTLTTDSRRCCARQRPPSQALLRCGISR